MTRKMLLLVLLFALTVPSLMSGTFGQAAKTRDCNQEAEANIDKAIQYLRMRIDTLENDYEFDDGLPRKDDRVRRRMDRKIDEIKVHCGGDFRCRDNRTGVSTGLITDRIHICYERAKELGYSFCDLVEVVAHEYAHMIGMPRDPGHNNGPQSDATYMFGWFAQDLCKRDSVDRPLADFSNSLRPNPRTATSGIIVFPHSDFQGRGRNFNREFRDLRQIGHNDAVSSVRVLSGTWELCQDPDFGGWCRLFSRDDRNLKENDFNNQVSSLRPVTLPRRGITLFQGVNFQGGSRNFTGAVSDLNGSGINDRVSALQIHSGSWEICKDSNFRDCRVFDSSQPDLRRVGFNDKISSLRPR